MLIYILEKRFGNDIFFPDQAKIMCQRFWLFDSSEERKTERDKLKINKPVFFLEFGNIYRDE